MIGQYGSILWWMMMDESSGCPHDNGTPWNDGFRKSGYPEESSISRWDFPVHKNQPAIGSTPMAKETPYGVLGDDFSENVTWSSGSSLEGSVNFFWILHDPTLDLRCVALNMRQRTSTRSWNGAYLRQNCLSWRNRRLASYAGAAPFSIKWWKKPSLGRVQRP